MALMLQGRQKIPWEQDPACGWENRAQKLAWNAKALAFLSFPLEDIFTDVLSPGITAC
jgi:hypothetical protein